MELERANEILRKWEDGDRSESQEMVVDAAWTVFRSIPDEEWTIYLNSLDFGSGI